MTPRRRTKVDEAPDEQELELLVHGDIDELEAIGWDTVVRRLVLAGLPRPLGEDRTYSYIDYIATVRDRRRWSAPTT